MGKLDGLVHNGSDRRRIVVKEFPERKSEDGPLDHGKGGEGVAGGDRLQAAVEVIARGDDAPDHLAPEGGGAPGRDLAVLAGDLIQATLEDGLGIVVRCLCFVEGLDHEAARAAQDVIAHAITMPPSTWMHWPVM